MNNQFVIPKHTEPEDVPFSKDYFRKRKRNIAIEQKAINENYMLDIHISGDLLSNLVTAEEEENHRGKPHVVITKEFTFAASHALPYHKGKCRYIHGHEWKLLVSVKGAVNKQGMVIDFGDLKKIVNEVIIDKMDHAYINALLFNPTAENLCFYIWNLLQYQGGLKGIEQITLYETPTSHAILTVAEMSKAVKGMWDWKTQEVYNGSN